MGELVCCGRDMVDATTTTEHPDLYEKYPAFRGNKKKRVYLCLTCKKTTTIEEIKR